jgi:hypothetical protein
MSVSKDGQFSNYLPESSEVFDGQLSEEADLFLTTCNVEFNIKQKLLHKYWLVDFKRYDVDLKKGLLFITRSENPRYVFDVTSVGSCNLSAGNWEWSWNNPNVEQKIAVSKQTLVPVAKQYNLKYLMSGFVPVPNESFGWYLSGISMKITDAIGVYEVNYNELSSYLLLYNPREEQE